MQTNEMTLAELVEALRKEDAVIASMERAGKTHTELCDHYAVRRSLARLIADRAAERIVNPFDTDKMRDLAIRYLAA